MSVKGIYYLKCFEFWKSIQVFVFFYMTGF